MAESGRRLRLSRCARALCRVRVATNCLQLLSHDTCVCAHCVAVLCAADACVIVAAARQWRGAAEQQQQQQQRVMTAHDDRTLATHCINTLLKDSINRPQP